MNPVCLSVADGCDGPAEYRVVHRSEAGRVLRVDEPWCHWHAMEQVERLSIDPADEVTRAYFAPLSVPLPVVDAVAGAPRMAHAPGTVKL